MAGRKKSAEPANPNHVVVELRVNQQSEYQTVNKRTDDAWAQRERDWLSPKGRKKFAEAEMRGGFGFDLSQEAEIASITSTPTDVQHCMEAVREWYKKNFFVQAVVRLKTSLFNYGFEIKPVEKSDTEALDAWKARLLPRIKRMVREMWTDKLVMKNAVAVWREPAGSRGPQVFVIPPERCKYSDALGMEKLEVKFGWKEDDFISRSSSNQKTASLLNKDLVKRYATGNYVLLQPQNGEQYRVYKEERVGWGFAWPDLQSLFHTMATQESLEISDRLWSFTARRAETRHRLGHEVKQGPRAGLPIHFITSERSSAVLGFYEGRVGFFDTAVNFDDQVEFPFPSSDRFNKEKYDAIWTKIAHWAGPAGYYLWSLYTGKGSLPMLMEMIQPEADEAREFMCDYLMDVITGCYKPPAEIKLCWSNRIFQERRQALEMVKFLVGSGALSQATALELNNFDPETERERKQEEWDLAQSQKTKGQVFPVYDPAHGDPNQIDSGGRPAGQKDSGSRVALNGNAPEE